MTDYANGILNSIRNDADFKFNPVIMAVVENLEAKRQTYQIEEDYLQAIRESLASVNGYIQSQRIEEILTGIDEKLGSGATTNVHTKVNRMYYEIDMRSAVSAIRESSIYAEPVVKNYIDSAIAELSTNKMPTFKYLPGFMQTMSVYRTNETVNEWLTKFEEYYKTNEKKLIML